MAELFKFRCYQCQKLIGTTSSKFGKVVHCPRCGVDLIVPVPGSDDPPPDESDPEAFRPEDLGLNLGFERLAEPKVAPAPVLDSIAPNPIDFLERASEIGDVPSPDSRDEPIPDPDESRNEPNLPPEADLPEAKVESLIPRRRGVRSTRPNELTTRSRDVVISRTAFVAWAMFALFSLAFAFAAGLMIGHFLWK